jgi:hypothetical protein
LYLVVQKKSADKNKIPHPSKWMSTYEQALRGLFTIGTSSLASEKSGKGRWQTGIEILPSSPVEDKT